MPKRRWRRSALVWQENVYTFAEDWTLIDENGNRLARIFNLGVDDAVEGGTWRWRVYRDAAAAIYGGSAETGPDAKAICEGLQDKGP